MVLPDLDNSGEQMHPLISVVTPCLDSESTIERTLDSLLFQQQQNFESVVVDGGSTDHTPRILRRYSQLFAAAGIAFSFTSERDHGIYDAVNKGIARSRGTLIGILNSDDFYEPHALQDVERTYKCYPNAGIFYGFLRQLRHKRELVIHRYNYDYILSDLESGVYSAAQHPACFVKRAVYQDIGDYDTSFPTAADYDFLLRARRTGVVFVPIDSVLVNFVSGGASYQVTEFDRLEQRFRAQYNNQLLSEEEYKRQMRRINYRRLRFSWRQVARRILRL